MFLNRNYELALAIRRFRRWRTNARLHAIVKKSGLVHFQTDDWTRSEIRAHDLARRIEESTDWLPRPILPVGGAAGPLFTYLLVRALTELDIHDTLELGCGQSTRILAGWVAQSRRRSVVSLEHDESWARRLGAEISSEQIRVLHRPLSMQPGPHGKQSAWYSPPLDDDVPKQGFGLVLVDGPIGTQRFSRVGIVNHLPDWLAERWTILWDDVDRPADLESFALAVSKLRALGVPHDHLVIDGDRSVGMIFSPAHTSMRFVW